MKYLIGIDIGTSATKTVMFDEKFGVICSSSQEYPMYQPQNGWPAILRVIHGIFL